MNEETIQPNQNPIATPVSYHEHNGMDSPKLNPRYFLGFPQVSVSNAFTAPTDTPLDGTIRFLYDSSTYVQWVRLNGTWESSLLSNPASRTRGTATLGLGTSSSSANEPIDFDTKTFDDNSEFDFFNITGTNTSTGANELIDSGANFTSAYLNRIAYNTSTKKYARITSVDSTTQVTLSSISDGADIFPSSSVGYRIFGNRWTCKSAGYYHFDFRLAAATPADGELTQALVYKNGTLYDENIGVSGGASSISVEYSDIIKLSVGDYIEFMFIFGSTSRVVKTTLNSFAVFRVA